MFTVLTVGVDTGQRAHAMDPPLIGFLRESATTTNVHVVGVAPDTAALTDEDTTVFSSSSSTPGFTYEPHSHRVHGLINGGGGNVYTYDIATQTSSLSPLISLSSGNGISSIGYLEADRKTGKLYCFVRDSNEDRFVSEVNPTTGVITPIGPAIRVGFPLFGSTGAIDSDLGLFIFVAQDQANANTISYFRINLMTGAQAITPVVGDYPSDLAYDSFSQMLFGVRFHFQSSTGQLYSVNLATGVNTQIGNDFDLATFEPCLSFDSQAGVGYFAGRPTTMTDSSARAIYTVTLGTGAASTSPAISFNSITPNLRNGFHGLVAIDQLTPPPTDVRIIEVMALAGQDVRIRLQTTPGKSYRVTYGALNDFFSGSSTGLFPGGASQQTAVGTEMEWIDSGPPATTSHPSVTPYRFFAVEEL